MTPIDWTIMGGTLFLIAFYGAWKTRQNKDIESYLLGGKKMTWGAIGLSVMANQASAITFLSTPGQAYESGLGFVQFYFGLPLAITVLCAFILPIYYRLNVFTAYEYLESRFDLRVRLLTAFLFLVSRGLAAGITIYAPAIILSSILGWNLNLMNLTVGLIVIAYTVSGGTRAVALTQKWQMAVIMLGMFTAFGLLISYIPVSFGKSIDIAGLMGKMEAIDLSFDLNNRYTLWSGLTGGFFLALSYFGTDQSQVQRYLGGKDLRASKMGLFFNAWVKIPMQLFILLTGVLVFVFFQFREVPAFFNEPARQAMLQSEASESYQNLEAEFQSIHTEKTSLINAYAESPNDELANLIRIQDEKEQEKRSEIKELISETDPLLETKDSDYIFINFILNFLPTGVVGLLLAVILSAAMSSTAGELNALASTTVIDFYKRIFKKDGSERHYLNASKLFTMMWGFLAILFAVLAQLVDNLIQAVNILGSLFYGTILGIFVVAFVFKFIKSKAVLLAAIISEIFVLGLFYFSEIGFLLFNVIGCLLVVSIASILQLIIGKDTRSSSGL